MESNGLSEAHRFKQQQLKKKPKHHNSHIISQFNQHQSIHSSNTGNGQLQTDSSPNGSHTTTIESSLIGHYDDAVRKKLVTLLIVYATLIALFTLTYSAYYLLQQVASRGQPRAPLPASAAQTQQQQQQQPEAAQALQQQQQQQLQMAINQSAELETKLHLLERYIELIALDLQETKTRLKEREKCHCNLGCTFNGTQFAHDSTWQNGCDTCTCKSGQISCSARKCPAANCDDAIQLPGKCCPVCMKKCKHNKRLIRHGESFSPTTNGRSKECTCHDGLIRCSSEGPNSTNRQRLTGAPDALTSNEYRKSTASQSRGRLSNGVHQMANKAVAE